MSGSRLNQRNTISDPARKRRYTVAEYFLICRLDKTTKFSIFPSTPIVNNVNGTIRYNQNAILHSVYTEWVQLKYSKFIEDNCVISRVVELYVTVKCNWNLRIYDKIDITLFRAFVVIPLHLKSILRLILLLIQYARLLMSPWKIIFNYIMFAY